MNNIFIPKRKLSKFCPPSYKKKISRAHRSQYSIINIIFIFFPPLKYFQVFQLSRSDAFYFSPFQFASRQKNWFTIGSLVRGFFSLYLVVKSILTVQMSDSLQRTSSQDDSCTLVHQIPSLIWELISSVWQATVITGVKEGRDSRKNLLNGAKMVFLLIGCSMPTDYFA